MIVMLCTVEQTAQPRLIVVLHAPFGVDVLLYFVLCFFFFRSVFVLIHKMDLVQEEMRESVFQNRRQAIAEQSGGIDCTFFKTSIWDETLYKV